MLGKRASVACAFALCVLSSNFQPQSASAGETQSASVLVVPVPVPAVRPRKAALPPPPPPPAPEIDPIENLAGKWSGQATMVPASGRNEQFRCIITYEVAGEASRVRQHLRCQGENRNFDAVTRMDIVDEQGNGRLGRQRLLDRRHSARQSHRQGLHHSAQEYLFRRPIVGRILGLPADRKARPPTTAASA